MELRLLLATSYYEISDDLQGQLSRIGIKAVITKVKTIDELVSELKKGSHHFIVAEYTLEGIDIWDMAKLVNSAQLSAHALPIYLLKDELEDEIAPLLAKEHGIKPIEMRALATTLKTDYESNAGPGYTRAYKPHEKPTLLAIEDDEDAAELIRHNLKNHYQIDIAHTGEAGLSLWESKRHDLVLLDHMLPGMQGDEVLERMMGVDKNQPVIIMTAYDLPNRNTNMILNGASEYLCKPFENEILKERCQAILGRAKLIYQMHYTTTKLEKLGSLLWLLDHHMNHNQNDKATEAMKAIKLIVPFVPPEDDHAALLEKGP